MERQPVAKPERAEGAGCVREAARRPVESLSAADRVMRLHRAVGNRAAGRFIQAKLRVGSPHDRSEVEADAVAEQVMRMPDPASPVEAGPDEPGVRRSCPSCGSAAPTDEDLQVRRRCHECEAAASGPHPVDEEEEKAIHPLAKDGEGGEKEPGSINEHTLALGGEPLPSPVRTFYEGRFGRDFSQVRVHTGPLAWRYNDRLHAYAFTYAHHIWMGRGQPVHVSALLAHELAHVVQQHRPARIVTKRRGLATPATTPEGGGPVVRRFAPFWEPYDIRSGEDNHEIILPAFGRKHSLFTEAPVPNARTFKDLAFGIGHGFGLTGRADLYRASTTVGAFFLAHGKPQTLKSNRLLMKDGGPFAHAANAAPQVKKGALVGSANAPSKIELGELKPSHGTVQALIGPIQLDNYRKGFEFAHKEAHDAATPGDGTQWTLTSVGPLGDLQPPEQFVHPTFKGQSARRLVLKRGTSKTVFFNPRNPVEGHLAVRPSPDKGVWNYTWVPINPPSAAMLPPKARALGPEIQQVIIDPLTASPFEPAKKLTPTPAHAAKKAKPGPPPDLTPEPTPVVRRQAAVPEKDHFPYSQWRESLKDITGRYKKEAGTSEFKEAEGNVAANEAHDAIREKFGLPLPAVVGSKEAAKELSKIKFWTGWTAEPFGLFRYVFGGAFVKIAKFFIKIRDKVRDFIKKIRTKVTIGSGVLGAALKAAFRGLKVITRFVVTRVVDRVLQSLFTGVAKKLTALIPTGVEELADETATKIAKIRSDIETKAADSVDSMVERVLGVHMKTLEKLENVYEFASKLIQVVNLVRWGARVIACLSPPGFGCLWILAEGALEYAMQKVAETCWFQEKIQPILAGIEYFNHTLPNKLADGLLDNVRGFLPDSVSDVFADLRREDVKPGKGDALCEEDDKTEYQESALHRQIDEFYSRIGNERALAMQELAKKMGVPRDRPLTAEQLTKLVDAISNIDPKKLQEYADKYPAVPEGVPPALPQTIGEIKDAPATPTPAPPSTTTPPEQGAGEGSNLGEGPDEKGQAEKPEGERGTEAGSESGRAGGGGIVVVQAKDRPTAKKTTNTMDNTPIVVLNPSWKHMPRTKQTIDVIIFAKGEAKVVVKGIETVMGTPFWLPRGAKSESEAIALVLNYIVLKGIDVPELGGFIPEKDVIYATLHTKTGQKVLERIRAEQAAGGPKK